MDPAYDPHEMERRWFARWTDAGLFHADSNSPKPKYSIALPPPNITGELHMGHAMNGTLQDVWARYRRMTGYEVLWQPGTDHAAISTQNVIEKRLALKGTTKEEIGREAFADLVDEWYRNIGATIIEQYKELGVSIDLARLRFTMDSNYVRAVRTAFVRYYEKGMLYRGPRIVNWCPRCLSAISDLEVDWRERDDTLYFIRYPIDDAKGDVKEVVIATVRPETMLFDTGVAVHPDDITHRHLVGRNAILPLVGRRLPIVADEAVDRDLGSGALKVTPGHDPLDYEIGQRNGLQLINGMHPDGRLNVPELPEYDGLPALAARKLVVQNLGTNGFMVEAKTHTHEVGHCDRCGTVIEPLLSEQWFLRMRDLADQCIAASERGEVRWHPARFERTYLDWLRGIRDWCVSRQLWLGHAIPIYTCSNGHQFGSVDEPVACVECGSAELAQDPDVLDTWFSSALWPFATLGWPDKTDDLRIWYPTDLNVTARDIINLWIARMIFSGLVFMGDVPFADVIVHATILAADGRRMSKSLGTGIDPRDIMRKYGADALRAWASAVAMSNQDVRFDETRIEGFRRFSTKLWNATRLVLNGLADDSVRPLPPDSDLRLPDRWILARLQSAIDAVTRGVEEYAFHVSMASIYDFAWHDFCDWYLESVKVRLRDGDAIAHAVCLNVLDVLFRLLHPFMPYITEELWHRLPGERDFLVRARWPQSRTRIESATAEREFGQLIAIVEEVRRLRNESGVSDMGGMLRLDVPLGTESIALISSLARVEIASDIDGPSRPLTEIAGEIHFPTAEAGTRRDAGLQKLRAEAAKLQSILENVDFRTKAPPDVVHKQEARLAEARAAIARLEG